MKILNILFALIALVFAYLQFNDPDPYIWVPIYLLVALIAAMASFGKYNKILIWVGIILFTGCCLYEIPHVVEWLTEHKDDSLLKDMQDDKPWIEHSREFGGLLISLIMLLIIRKQSVN
ncbi:MAG: hypothetical protein HKO56_03570 [Bacteroidia bacterium]|nr:hypothetical protein [Bacteroidia bacterium]